MKRKKCVMRDILRPGPIHRGRRIPVYQLVGFGFAQILKRSNVIRSPSCELTNIGTFCEKVSDELH